VHWLGHAQSIMYAELQMWSVVAYW